MPEMLDFMRFCRLPPPSMLILKEGMGQTSRKLANIEIKGGRGEPKSNKDLHRIGAPAFQKRPEYTSKLKVSSTHKTHLCGALQLHKERVSV